MKKLKAGAIVFKTTKSGKHKFLIVKRSGGKGWTLPKGSIERKECELAAAIREVYEEAGVLVMRASLVQNIMTRTLSKEAAKREDTKAIVYYLFSLVKELDTYPEANMRKRKWVTFDKARTTLDPELVEFLNLKFRRLGIDF